MYSVRAQARSASWIARAGSRTSALSSVARIHAISFSGTAQSGFRRAASRRRIGRFAYLRVPDALQINVDHTPRNRACGPSVYTLWLFSGLRDRPSTTRSGQPQLASATQQCQAAQSLHRQPGRTLGALAPADRVSDQHRPKPPRDSSARRFRSAYASRRWPTGFHRCRPPGFQVKPARIPISGSFRVCVSPVA